MTLQHISIALIVVILMSFALFVAAQHDTQIQLSAQQYERCVFESFHMSPVEYYHMHHSYPPCFTSSEKSSKM